MRRFLPKLLRDIEFKAAPAGAATLQSFQYLARLLDSRKPRLEEAPLEIVSPPGKRLVFDKEGRVTKRGYTRCFLDKLQDSLRRRDVYVEKSDRWGDPRAKLLQGPEWEAHRILVCRSLGHPLNPREAIQRLVCQLEETYQQIAANFNNNKAVELDRSGKWPTLTITHFDKLDESPSLTLLAQQVETLLNRPGNSGGWLL